MLMLVVSAFFAGRMSLLHQLELARQEAAAAKRAQARAEWQAAWANRLQTTPYAAGRPYPHVTWEQMEATFMDAYDREPEQIRWHDLR
jgi:hypothetical protein